MIDKLQIKNFKVHADTKLDLSNINILTGMNGMGKSSVIQSLLLLRQTQIRGFLRRGLELNGELSSIGVASDAMYKYADSDHLELILTQDKKVYDWSFKVDSSNLSKTFIQSDNNVDFNPEEISLFTNDFQYISAFRNGPVGDYEKDTSSVELLNQISRREGRSELVAHYFDFFNQYIVHDSLLKNIEADHSVRYQVEEWMREISPNLNIDVTPRDTSYVINYSYNRGQGETRTEPMRDTNIGFGVSYVLPIVVATLVANSRISEEGSEFKAARKLIIIENPEAHIHPRAQAKLMELICLAAANGVQFIIETHSDHIINGLLVAIKQKVLALDKAKIYYLTRNEKEHSSVAHPLDLQPGGKIRQPPAGFFDQIDISMKTLIGF
jgi:predicted ATPase